MNILLFAHHHLTKWKPHGGEKSMLAIVKYLRDRRHKVHVLVNNQKNSEQFTEEEDGITYEVVNNVDYVEHIQRAVAKKPDVALTWGMHSHFVVPICYDHGIPVVFFLRYWSPMMPP